MKYSQTQESLDFILDSPLPNFNSSFEYLAYEQGLEAGRSQGIKVILDNLPQVLRYRLNDSDSNDNKIELLDVNDATIDRRGTTFELLTRIGPEHLLRALSGYHLFVPRTKEDLKSGAYQEFWKGLEDLGLSPFISIDNWRNKPGFTDTIAAICITKEDAVKLLERKTLS